MRRRVLLEKEKEPKLGLKGDHTPLKSKVLSLDQGPMIKATQHSERIIPKEILVKLQGSKLRKKTSPAQECMILMHSMLLPKLRFQM
jgi:hypothetical protein